MEFVSCRKAKVSLDDFLTNFMWQKIKLLRGHCRLKSLLQSGEKVSNNASCNIYNSRYWPVFAQITLIILKETVFLILLLGSVVTPLSTDQEVSNSLLPVDRRVQGSFLVLSQSAAYRSKDPNPQL